MVIDARPLTSLDEAQSVLFESCYPVTANILPIFGAIGKYLAEDIAAKTSLPEANIALREGWAVKAQDTYGATSLSPNFLSAPPAFVALGDPLPGNTDAVLPEFAVSNLNGTFEVLSAAFQGESSRRAGEDIAGAEIIAAAGTKLTNRQALILSLADVAHVPVFSPHARIFLGNSLGDPAFIAEWLEKLFCAEGAETSIVTSPSMTPPLDEVLTTEGFDLIILLIDPGKNLKELASRALADTGLVIAQGLAVRPGEAICCGLLPNSLGPLPIPAILVPPRLENVFAAWLLLIRPCLDRLMNKCAERPGEVLTLSRKLASSLGRSDLVLLKVQDREGLRVFEPLGVGDITWSALAKATHWLIVPPQSEGYARGEAVFGEHFE